MIKVEELLSRGHISVEYWRNFSMEVNFTLKEEGKFYFMKYVFHFDPTYRIWSYELKKSANIEFPKKEQNNIRLKVEKIIEKQRKKREQRAIEILDHLTFTHEYEIATLVHLGDKKEISLNNVTIGKRKAKISWFLFGDKTLEMDIEHEENVKEEYFEVNFTFSRSFALQHLKGFKKFEDFLYKESKDRLGLLFQEKNAQ